MTNLRMVECTILSDRATKEPTKVRGYFHQWGMWYEEFEIGPGNYSIAIVELESGEVETFPANRVKFID